MIIIRRPFLWPLAVAVLISGPQYSAPISVAISPSGTAVPNHFSEQLGDSQLSSTTLFSRATQRAKHAEAKALAKLDHGMEAFAGASESGDAKSPTLESLLETNSSTANLLELSDAMLANATRLIAEAANDRRFMANTTNPTHKSDSTRRHEELTIKELADHSGQLQKLFQQLENDLDGGEDADEGADEIGAHGADAHIEAAMSTIEFEDVPVTNLRTHPEAHRTDENAAADSEIRTRWLLTGLVVTLILAIGALAFGLRMHFSMERNRDPTLDEEAKPAVDAMSVPGGQEGNTSYVIRIVKATINDLPSSTAVAWQLSVAGDVPRPSRFTKDMVWDAPVDRLDLDVEDPHVKISVAVLAASESLGVPITLATVDVPAGVLLAEARGNKEKLRSSGDSTAYTHEKKLVLYPRGEIILEYSLIAFFHWYVGPENRKEGA